LDEKQLDVQTSYFRLTMSHNAKGMMFVGMMQWIIVFQISSINLKDTCKYMKVIEIAIV
jgi:hypothetical protein